MASEGTAELEIILHRGASGAYYLDFHFRLPEMDHHLEQTEVKFDIASLSRVDPGTLSYAQALSAQLFGVDQVRSAFTRAIDIASSRDIPLNIRLYISQEVGELHDLHWEALLHPHDGSPLFTRPDMLFSRYLSSRRLSPVDRRSPDQLKALVVVSNPSDLTEYPQLGAIDVPLELQRARQGLGSLRVVELPGPETSEHASLNAILGILRGADRDKTINGFDILYLVCHGTLKDGEPYVWFQNERGLVARVHGQELVRRLAELEKPPNLIVLASCESAGHADGQALTALGPRLVEAGIPAVLAMQGSISMDTIARFMPVFFAELIRDGQIHRAISVARGEVSERSDWWMPVLFSCLRDNRLFDLPSGETANTIQRQYFEPETVYIPAGSFLMGQEEASAGAAHETPQHEVFLPGYRIGKYPVTNYQYEVFINHTRRLVRPEMAWDGQNPPQDRLEHPVEGVTWFDTLAYCEWLSETTGRQYGLPSEAQWEKAARGPDGRRYPWGEAWEPGRSNHGSAGVAPVDRYQAQSLYGCFDLVGNVRQWTRTLWGSQSLRPDPRYLYPYREDGRDDLNANRETRRVLRGSSYLDELAMIRCSLRASAAPDYPGPPGKRYGFRVVMEV